MADAFLDALHADFQASRVEAITAARAESPLGYVRIVASLPPLVMQVENAAGGLSDGELALTIRQARIDSVLSYSDATGGRVN